MGRIQYFINSVVQKGRFSGINTVYSIKFAFLYYWMDKTVINVLNALQEYIMSMCNPMVEEQIQYTADLHEHLVGKGGKTHRYLESNSRYV